MLFGRVLLVYCCLWYTVCRKTSDMIFTPVLSTRDFGMLPMMIAIAASEAMGLDSESSRILFSFIILIASLREGMCRMFLPPASLRTDMWSMTIGRGASESDMTVLTDCV